MQSSKSPSVMALLPTFLILFLIGWGGLFALVFGTLPTLGPRWLFFALIMIALTGTALPVVYFFNRRFPVRPPVQVDVLLRESIWFGVLGCLLVWLQLGQLLTIWMGLILFSAIALIEGLLRMWEHSRWKPKEKDEG
jgi:hypothetical protein